MILVFCGRSFGCSLGRPTINIPILLGWLAHHSSFGVLYAAEKIDGNTKNIITVLLHGEAVGCWLCLSSYDILRPDIQISIAIIINTIVVVLPCDE